MDDNVAFTSALPLLVNEMLISSVNSNGAVKVIVFDVVGPEPGRRLLSLDLGVEPPLVLNAVLLPL